MPAPPSSSMATASPHMRPMIRTPSLDALRIFAVAARRLSFTEAASELNLTQSAVSHRIRRLEEDLGLALFTRLTRRMELTPSGRTLAHRVDHAIGEINRTIAELAGPQRDGPLKVTMLPSVASHWLIPRLPRIRSSYPDLDIQIVADPRLLDLRAEGIDLAIRFGRAPAPGYAATRLMGDCVFPVCAPAFLKQHGPIRSVDALLALPLLHDSPTNHDGSNSGWRNWLDHLGRQDLDCDSGQQFSEAGLLIDAAALGLGVALTRASLVADHLARGALVCPLRRSAPTAFAYYLIGLPEAAVNPRVTLFRDIMLAEAAATEACMASIDAPCRDDAEARIVGQPRYAALEGSHGLRPDRRAAADSRAGREAVRPVRRQLLAGA